MQNTIENLVDTINEDLPRRSIKDGGDSISDEIGAPFVTWANVPMHRAVFEGENTIEVVAGTSAPIGEAHTGSQTVIMLHDLGHTTIQSVRVMVRDPENPEPCGLVLVLGGDSEARTIADALEFASKVIRKQLTANHAGQG